MSNLSDFEDNRLYEFHYQAVDRPEDPYYITNWDHGFPVTVVAENKKDAVQELWRVLGDAGSNRNWLGQLQKITPHIKGRNDDD